MYGKRPQVPSSPIIPPVQLLHEVHPVSSAQQLNLRPFADGHDIDTMALVRVDIEAFSQNAANPPVRDGPMRFISSSGDWHRQYGHLKVDEIFAGLNDTQDS